MTIVGALSASPAAAQVDAFRDALIGFHSTLAGDYGDEGPLVLRNLDRMASSLSAWDTAIRDAEQNARTRLVTASASESVRVHGALAQLYIERGRYPDAVRELDAAIQIDGMRGSLHVLRGLVLETMGRPGDDVEAIRAFRRAWQIDREDPVSAYLLSSRPTNSTPSNELTPQTSQLVAALNRRFATGPARHIDLFPQIALVPDAAAVTPVFSPARYAEGFTLVEKGRYLEAVASFRRAVARDPLVVDAPARLERLQPAIGRLRDGDAESAVPLLEAAVAAAPGSSEAHRILAAAYGDVGNDAMSIQHFESAAGLAPDDERANLALGRELADAGQVDRAEQVFISVAQKLPQSTDVHSALADLYERSDRGRKALHELEIAATFTVISGKSALYLRLGDLEHRHLEYERVIDPLTRRTRLDPNNARAHTDLGLAYTRVGRTSDALLELVVASLLGPDDAEALTAIGQIHFDAGRYAVAESVLARAIAVTPGLVQARYLLGQTLDRLGRPNESRAQLTEYDRLRAAANDNFRHQFEVDMLRKDALRAAAAARPEEAVAAWQKVVDGEPKSVSDRVALANALVQAGRPEAAVEQLEAASRLDDSDRETYRQLAELYSKLGRASDSARARQTYQRLLQENRRGR
ncbi:MAG TPA: tetratricopeptide repeat protein [Vicinamibacterales bacterium]|nr:tetratricopeptide repeat protein [Vicinamibacterales bacterium]